MTRSTQEYLEWLHLNGWGDNRIAHWITLKINDFLAAGIEIKNPDWKGGAGILIGPNARSIARWRKGESKPTSNLHSRLIAILYLEQQNGTHSKH